MPWLCRKYILIQDGYSQIIYNLKEVALHFIIMQTPEYTWPSRLGSPLCPALQSQASTNSFGNEVSSPPSEKSPSEVTLLDLTGCKKSTASTSSSSLEFSTVSSFDAAEKSGPSATELKLRKVTAKADTVTDPAFKDINTEQRRERGEGGIQTHAEHTASAPFLLLTAPAPLTSAESVETVATASYTVPLSTTSKALHLELEFDTPTSVGTSHQHTMFGDDSKMSQAEIQTCPIGDDSTTKPAMDQLCHENGRPLALRDVLDRGPSQACPPETTPTPGETGYQHLKDQQMEDSRAMPEKRKKKKPRCLYDERQMIKAVQMVEGGSSIMAAARHYNIPRATLWCRMKRDYPCAKLQTGPPSALLDEEEEAVCQWVAAMTAIGKPQTFKSLALIVKEVLDAAGRRNVFTNNKPSEGWIGKFKRKHMQLFSKKPEATTLRDNITADDINKFFCELDYHLQSEDLCPDTFLSPAFAHRVFNLDEAGVYIPNDDCLSKLLMRRSERCNLQGCGDSRQMVTVVSCASAAGLYIRPLLLFKEPRIPFKTGCPGVDNSSFNVGISELGWMDHKAFLYWLQHFEDQLSEVSVEKPVLLLLDGHSPHISVTALEYAKECGVILHQIPPHTSHLLQPIYLALYKDLKRAYREVVIENWPKDDRVMNKKQFPAIFMEAWKRTAHSSSLVDGYKEAGIIPRDAVRVTNKLTKDGDSVISSSGAATKTRQLNSLAQRESCKASPLTLYAEKDLADSQQSLPSEQPQVSSTPSISLSSLQALLSSKAEEVATGALPPSSSSSGGDMSSYHPLQPCLGDSSEFIQGLQDAIGVVKEYIPKQVSDIYEKWIEEQNTTCTSDTLYHIWLCLHNKIPQHLTALITSGSNTESSGGREDGLKCGGGATFSLPDKGIALSDTLNKGDLQESVDKCSVNILKNSANTFGDRVSIANTSTDIQKQVLRDDSDDINAPRFVGNSSGTDGNNINSTNFNGVPVSRHPATNFSDAMSVIPPQYPATTPTRTTTPSNTYLTSVQNSPSSGGSEYLVSTNCSVGDASNTLPPPSLQHHLSQVQQHQHNFGFSSSSLSTSPSALQCDEYNRNMNVAHGNMMPMTMDHRSMAPITTASLRATTPLTNNPPVPRGTMDPSDRHLSSMGPNISMADLSSNVSSDMTARSDCYSSANLYRQAGKHPMEQGANYQPQDKRYRM